MRKLLVEPRLPSLRMRQKVIGNSVAGEVVTSYLHASLAIYRRCTVAPCHLSIGSWRLSAIAAYSSFYASVRITDEVRFVGPQRDFRGDKISYVEARSLGHNATSMVNPFFSFAEAHFAGPKCDLSGSNCHQRLRRRRHCRYS